MASQASCRTILEQFADSFKKRHKRKKFQLSCKHCLDGATNTDVFGHFEICCAVADCDKLLMGNELSSKLQKGNIQLPSSGSFAQLYSALSEKIHHTGLAKLGQNVLVPDTLSGYEKRFLIRYIYAALGDEVLIATGSTLRKPAENEIITPPTTPPDKPRLNGKRKRK